MASEEKGPSAIARLVLAQYDALPPRGKPQERHLVAFAMREQQSTQRVAQGPEWTVLAGVVASEGGEQAGCKQRWADGTPRRRGPRRRTRHWHQVFGAVAAVAGQDQRRARRSAGAPRAAQVLPLAAIAR